MHQARESSGYDTFTENKKGRKTMQQSHKTLDTIVNSMKNVGNEYTNDQKMLNDSSAQRLPNLSKDFSDVSIERKLVGASTVHFSNSPDVKSMKNTNIKSKRREGSNSPSLVFPNDVKIEHKIKGEVSMRAIETWINETLSDAYHLEIPGVIAEPHKKKPTLSYGIDPTTLQSLGVSEKDVDRIYRALFVYSVGFFEFLKKILQATARNFGIITSIWKVYQVLLEYCCKTDYRILIAELTDRHNKELLENERINREKIQKLMNEKRIMKENLEAQ